MTRPDDHARAGGAGDSGAAGGSADSGGWELPGSGWRSSAASGWGDDAYRGDAGGYGTRSEHAWSNAPAEPAGAAATGFIPPQQAPGAARAAGPRRTSPWVMPLVAALAVVLLAGAALLAWGALGGSDDAGAAASPEGGPGGGSGAPAVTVTETATATATRTAEEAAAETRTVTHTAEPGTAPERDDVPSSGGGYASWGSASDGLTDVGFASGPTCALGESVLLAMETGDYRAVVCAAGSDAIYRGYGRGTGVTSRSLAAVPYATYSEPRAGGADVHRWEAAHGDTVYRVSPNGITILQGGEVVDDDAATFFVVAVPG
ncbi:hypothetical protein [Corynebacterium sp. 335C]